DAAARPARTHLRASQGTWHVAVVLGRRLAVEDRAAGHHQIDAGAGEAPDVLLRDRAVHAEENTPPRGLEQTPRPGDPPDRRRNEPLSAPARVDSEQKDQVDVIQQGLDRL